MAEYYVVNAFSDQLFHGNPAGVCVMDHSLSDDRMQKIAGENNLPETAFLRKTKEGYSLRWFTPVAEIDLCGHATLASAYVVLNFMEPGKDVVQFETMSGTLTVHKVKERYEMTLPTRVPERIKETEEIVKKVQTPVKEVYADRDLFLVLENEEAVRNYVPDYNRLAELDRWLGIVITAKGTDADFVSRYFCPELFDEDPVTGSSHCSLVPIWQEKLGKDHLIARQLSERGGVLFCEAEGEKTIVSGEACLYLKGTLETGE